MRCRRLSLIVASSSAALPSTGAAVRGQSTTTTTTHRPVIKGGPTPSTSPSPTTATSTLPPKSNEQEVMSVTVRRPQDRAPRPSASAARRLPAYSTVQRILLVRNGLSDMNTDITKILDLPDWNIGLNKEGEQECIAAGRAFGARVQSSPVYCYFSPYLRSKQSMESFLRGAFQVQKLNIVGVREDVRLRDGDMGRFQDAAHLRQCLEEQRAYGKFFYRFPHGESGADVCDRVSSFLDVFQRERAAFPIDTTVVIMTHDLTLRMLVKRWFHLNVETFHNMTSPKTAATVELERVDSGRYKLTEESSVVLGLPTSLNDIEGYTYRNRKLLGSLSTGAPFL